jgi:hypothetical protein
LIFVGFFFLKNFIALSSARTGLVGCDKWVLGGCSRGWGWWALKGGKAATPMEVGVVVKTSEERTERVLPSSYLFFCENSMMVCMKVAISPVFSWYRLYCSLTILITSSHFSHYCSRSLAISSCSSSRRLRVSSGQGLELSDGL